MEYLGFFGYVFLWEINKRTIFLRGGNYLFDARRRGNGRYLLSIFIGGQ